MSKIQYLTPEVQLFEVKLESTILSNVRTVEKMNEIESFWEEDD